MPPFSAWTEHALPLQSVPNAGLRHRYDCQCPQDLCGDPVRLWADTAHLLLGHHPGQLLRGRRSGRAIRHHKTSVRRGAGQDERLHGGRRGVCLLHLLGILLLRLCKHAGRVSGGLLPDIRCTGGHGIDCLYVSERRWLAKERKGG